MLKRVLIETNELIYFALNIKQNLYFSKKKATNKESETDLK